MQLLSTQEAWCSSAARSLRGSLLHSPEICAASFLNDSQAHRWHCAAVPSMFLVSAFLLTLHTTLLAHPHTSFLLSGWSPHVLKELA